MGRLSGKKAIVIGAATGLGAACVKAFAREGAGVFVADLDGDGAARVADEIKASGGTAHSGQVDLGDDGAVRGVIASAVEALGGLNVMHLNAADTAMIGQENIGIADVGDEMWNRILRVNPTGFFYAVRAAVPVMIEGGGGSIVMTSTTGAIRSEAVRGAYGVSKAAVDGLMRAVATAYGKKGIRCNSILPGAMLTPEYRDGPRKWPQSVIDNHLKHGLLQRVGNENDIANGAVFLASDDSSYITGHGLVVDGGLTVHMPHMVDEMAILEELLKKSGKWMG